MPAPPMPTMWTRGARREIEAGPPTISLVTHDRPSWWLTPSVRGDARLGVRDPYVTGVAFDEIGDRFGRIRSGQRSRVGAPCGRDGS